MTRKTLYIASLLFFSVLCLFSSPGFSKEFQQSQQAKNIIALVDKAAALVESKGEEVFPEFRKKGGEWYQGETYIFVDDLQGISRVNPPEPEIEGKNFMDTKDAKGKLFMREFMEVIKTKGSGWVEYWWAKPGKKKPAKKMSYIKQAKMPNGEIVIVGAGAYSK